MAGCGSAARRLRAANPRQALSRPATEAASMFIFGDPMKPEKPTGTVRLASDRISTEANTYSVQAVMKAKMPTLAMPGVMSGT